MHINKLSKKQQTLCLGFIIFFLIWLLNVFMPLHRDDYNYSLVWNTTQHLENMTDVLRSLQYHYMEHGGRMVAFFILDSFLLLPKAVFNFANALVYMGVLVLILWHSYGRITSDISPERLGLAFLFSWLCFPHYGEVAIWMCGATVYLWSGLFLLGYLLPYHIQWRAFQTGEPSPKGTLSRSLTMLFLGFLAGCSVENAAVTSVSLTILSIWYAYRQKKLARWQITGLIGNLSGFLFLIAAPGNFVRSMEQYGSLGRRIGNQFAGNAEMFLYIIPLLFAMALVYRLAKIQAFPNAKTWRTSHIGTGIYIMGIIAIIMIHSYMTTGYIGRWMGEGILHGILAPIGLPITERLTEHVMNITMRFEEMIVYLCTLYAIYRYCASILCKTYPVLHAAERKAYIKRLVKQYPLGKRIVLLVISAGYTNLAMLGAPTFPARATFFSVVLLMISVLSLGNIPSISEKISLSKKPIRNILVAFLLPFYLGTLYFSYLITQYDHQQMTIIAAHAKASHSTVVLQGIPFQQRMQRHIFYVDFDNPVTQSGVRMYYKIDGIRLEK